jgi:hypothetical protein
MYAVVTPKPKNKSAKETRAYICRRRSAAERVFFDDFAPVLCISGSGDPKSKLGSKDVAGVAGLVLLGSGVGGGGREGIEVTHRTDWTANRREIDRVKTANMACQVLPVALRIFEFGYVWFRMLLINHDVDIPISREVAIAPNARASLHIQGGMS